MPVKHFLNLSNDMITIDNQSNQPSKIVFHEPTDHSASTPMLEIRGDQFYVRGKPVPIDENEAKAVYQAFHQWLTWAYLSHDDRR